MFDLFDKFREYCEKAGILFILGGQEWQNKLSALKGLKPDQLMLGVEGNVSPTFNASLMTSVTYTLTVILGRKCEAKGTKSSMEETFEQKYDARLKDLMDQLALIMSSMVCENGYEITSFTMTPQINHLDLNIDCISSQVTIIVEP